MRRAALALMAAVAAAAPARADQDASSLRHELQGLVRDIGRIASPRGVDDARYVTLGGARQWITVRGQDQTSPVLLFLHGGPGGATSDHSYLFQRPWEDYFTVVQWDQRGFGRSAADGDALRGTINKERYIADAIELIDYLRDRFGQRKIVLVGQSWGTILAIELARRRPDLLHAVVTIGQQTGYEANFERTRELLIEHARQTGDAALEHDMQALGPPPPSSDLAKFLPWVFAVQAPMTRLGYSWHNFQGPEGDWGGRIAAARKLSPSVTDEDLASHHDFASTDAPRLAELLASVSGWDAARDVGTDFAVPVVILAGRYDWQTPIDRARAYYEKICAPWKMWVEFPNSAHVVTAEEPGRMIVTLVQDVLPAVEGRVPAGAERCARQTVTP